MPTYTKTTWVNDQAPAINDTNLNNIESGIDNLYSEFDANTILKADSDNTPVALAVATSSILGRKSTGGVAALTTAETKTLLAIAIADISDIPGTIATILTDHDKATHDALGIVPGSHGADKHTDRTRKLFIPATEGYTNGTISYYLLWAVVKFSSSTEQLVNVNFKVPEDYASGGTISFLYISNAIADGSPYKYVWYASLYHATDNELYSSNSSSDPSNNLIDPVDNKLHVVATSLSFTSLSKDDFVALNFTRADTAADDETAELFLVGFIFEYTADM